MKGSPYTYTISDYLQQLSSSAPTPGGGSTSALVASLGTAIAMMAARISDRTEEQEEIQQRVQRFMSFCERFERLCQDDIDSFQHVMTGLKNKENKEQQQQNIERAAEVPLQLAKECLHAMLLCEELVSRIENNVLSDLGCAVLFLHAACHGALLTMSMNTCYIDDPDQVRRFRFEEQWIRKESFLKCQEILRVVKHRMHTMSK